MEGSEPDAAVLPRELRLSSGYYMPVVGLGTWQITDEEELENALRVAIDIGYRLIDTAYVYGNEHIIGKVLKKLFNEGKVKRNELFIVTKLPGNGHKDVEYFCMKSLEALQLEYIDLYLIHSPISAVRTENDDEFMPMKDGKFLGDHTVDLVDTWRAMEQLVHKDVIRSIGLSNFNKAQIERILEHCQIRPSNLQVESHLYLPRYELQEFCNVNHISFTAYAPLGSPGFAGWCKKNYGVDRKFPNPVHEPKVKELAEKYNKTPSQILLRYQIQRAICVIPKSANAEHITENFKLFDFQLATEDTETLKALQNGFRYFIFDKPEGIKSHPQYPFNDPL